MLSELQMPNAASLLYQLNAVSNADLASEFAILKILNLFRLGTGELRLAERLQCSYCSKPQPKIQQMILFQILKRIFYPGFNLDLNSFGLERFVQVCKFKTLYIEVLKLQAVSRKLWRL